MLFGSLRRNGILHFLKRHLLFYGVTGAIGVELTTCLLHVHALAGGFSYRDHIDRFGRRILPIGQLFQVREVAANCACFLRP